MINHDNNFVFVSDIQYWRLVNDNIQFYPQHKKFYSNKDFRNSLTAQKINMGINSNVFHTCKIPPHFAFKNLNERFPQAGLTRGFKRTFSQNEKVILDIQDKYKDGIK